MVMHTSAARVTPAVRGSPGRRSDHCPGVRTPPGPLRGATPSTCPVRSRAPPAPPPGSAVPALGTAGTSSPAFWLRFVVLPCTSALFTVIYSKQKH